MKAILWKEVSDFAISWNGTNIEEIEEFLKETNSTVEQVDVLSLIINDQLEVVVGDYIIRQNIFKDDKVIQEITVIHESDLKELYKVEEM